MICAPSAGLLAKEIVLPYKFVHYSIGGVSSNWDALHREATEVAARQFGLCEKERARFEETCCLPIRILLPLLLHARGMIRRGAAWQVLRNAMVTIGLKR